MIRSYILTALRNINRSKTLSLINILGLSIGLACVLLVASYIRHEYQYDEFHVQKDRLYKLIKIAKDHNGNELFSGGSNLPQGPAFKEAIPEILSYCRISNSSVTVKTSKGLFAEKITYADSSFNNIFSFKLHQGNPATILREPTKVILTENTALKFFGTTDVIGKTLEIDRGGTLSVFSVEGVFENNPAQSSIQFGILCPMEIFIKSHPDPGEWGSNYLQTFLLMNKQVDYTAIESKLRSVYIQHAYSNITDEARKNSLLQNAKYSVQPLTDVHLNKEVSRRFAGISFTDKSKIDLLIKIALLVLFIAGANFVTLSLANSLRRRKEVGIRKVVGGTRGQLIGQFMSESFVLTFLCAPVAICLASFMAPRLSYFLNISQTIPLVFDSGFVLLSIAVLTITALLAGIYPAIILSGFQAIKVLSNKLLLTNKSLLSESLIVLQFAITIFFISATIILGKQYKFLTQRDLGYNTSDLLAMRLDMGDYAQTNVIKTALSKWPEVKGSTFTNWDWGATTHISIGKNQDMEVQYQHVDPDFLTVFEVALQDGRNFYPESSMDSASCLVNERFIKQGNFQNPLQQRISFGEREYNIVGVVSDYQYATLRSALKPMVIFKRKPLQYGEFFIKCQPGKTDEVKSKLPGLAAEFNPLSIPYAIELKHRLAEYYQSEDRLKSIADFSSWICIFLSCTGLFGLVRLSLQYRTKEIGIRKVLGARVADVAILISKNFIILIFIAMLIAAPLVWYLINEWLQGFAYRINIEWWMLALSGMLAIAIASLTIGFHVAKAAFANPVKSLHTE